MPFLVEHRCTGSSWPPVKNWTECAGGKLPTKQLADAEVEWWSEYDRFYSLQGWEYRIREVRK
jgi:hypothetical protein